jgi:hypothetical protein
MAVSAGRPASSVSASRRAIDPYDPAHVDWARIIDVLDVVHWCWRRAPAGQWFRFCMDIGPDISSRPIDLPNDTIVTCLWCLSVRDTL